MWQIVLSDVCMAWLPSRPKSVVLYVVQNVMKGTTRACWLTYIVAAYANAHLNIDFLGDVYMPAVSSSGAQILVRRVFGKGGI